MKDTIEIMTPEELVRASEKNNTESEKQRDVNLKHFKVWFNNMLQERIQKGCTFYDVEDTLELKVSTIPSEFITNVSVYNNKTVTIFKPNIKDYLRSKGWGEPYGIHPEGIIRLKALPYCKPKLPH